MGRVPRIPSARCRFEPRSGAPSAPRWTRDCDVLVCGASFAGLAVARELAGSGARVLDRRPLRDRRAPDLAPAPRRPSGCTTSGSRTSIRQTFGELVIHTPSTTFRWTLPWTFSTFDYRELCALLRAQAPDVEFDTAKVDGARRAARRAHRPRRPARAADRRRARLAARALQRAARDPAARRAPVARAGGPPRTAPATTSSCGSTPPTCAPATRWSFPAARRAARRRRLLRAARPRQGADRAPGRATSTSRPCATRATGSPTRCARRVEDGIFFVGDSAGHCLPTDGRGHPHRALLRPGLRARAARRGRGPPDARAGARRATPPSARSTAGPFTWLLRVQRWVGPAEPVPAP